MKYPRTPRSKWASVKIGPVERGVMRHLRFKMKESFTSIGKMFNVSHQCVRINIVPGERARRAQRQADARKKGIRYKSSPETRRSTYARKIKYCGKAFRNYHNQFNK